MRTFRIILSDSNVLAEEIKISSDKGNGLNYNELYKRRCMIDEEFSLSRKIGLLPLTIDQDLFTSFLKMNESEND